MPRRSEADRLTEIDAETEKLEREIDEMLAQVRRIAENADTAAQETVALQAKETLELSAASDARVELSALRAGVEGVSERRTTLERDLAEAREKLSAAQAESKANRRALNEAREEARAVANIIQGHSLKMDGRKRRAEEALRQVGLEDRISFYPGQLSGGQCQRVAIARAICTRPKLLLADEPTGALDSKAGQQIMDIFDELHDQGMTIVMITHEHAVAERARRILYIYDGWLREEAQA